MPEAITYNLLNRYFGDIFPGAGSAGLLLGALFFSAILSDLGRQKLSGLAYPPANRALRVFAIEPAGRGADPGEWI